MSNKNTGEETKKNSFPIIIVIQESLWFHPGWVKVTDNKEKKWMLIPIMITKWYHHQHRHCYNKRVR